MPADVIYMFLMSSRGFEVEIHYQYGTRSITISQYGREILYTTHHTESKIEQFLAEFRDLIGMFRVGRSH